MFITFEGFEGAGKTTQIKKLVDFLQQQGKKVLVTREPGGSVGGEAIRELLLNGDVDKWDNITEVLLFFAARRDHVEKVIKPALKRGEWVISDRFADSTVVYQLYGYKADNITKKDLDMVYDFTLKDFVPDLTLIFDIPVDVGINRKKAQIDGFNRYEKMNVEFHNNLRQGFLKVAQDEATRCKVINAHQDVEAVFNDMIELIKPCLA